MINTRNLYIIIILHSIIATPQINLSFTDSIDEDETQHDCLRMIASIDQSHINRQIISYCISESLSKYHLQQNEQFPQFTFDQLSEQNVTSQQLYLWSAPIDLIEQYQAYLDHLSTANDARVEENVFYNCTLPRFGSMCQYEFDYYNANYSSLYHMIYDFYHSYTDNSLMMTCYIDIECDRGPYPSCLAWTEICNGIYDCSNTDLDEKYCWQLEINQCNENEYRCTNGQCIPISFYQDDKYASDCLDGSDEQQGLQHRLYECDKDEPAFECEDITCRSLLLTSSCSLKRQNLLIQALYSIQDQTISDDCWLAFKCITSMPQPINPIHSKLCKNEKCISIIEENCPDVVLIPAVPVLFNQIYFAYTKKDLRPLYIGQIWPPYSCYNNSLYDEHFINGEKLIFNNLTCYRTKKNSSGFVTRVPVWEDDFVKPIYLSLNKYNLIHNYTFEICNKSTMYQCINSSKCISIYRLMNGQYDCPYNDDEDTTKINDMAMKEQIKQHIFLCHVSNKYIPQTLVLDGKCDCGYMETGWCEDENLDRTYVRRNISFQTICDRRTELSLIIIDGQNHTDETECQQWTCDNIYTHCDSFWQCPNGQDETDCYSLPSVLNCSSEEHLCVSPYTNQMICLPINKANDGNIDCIGATDESNICYHPGKISPYDNFYCKNDASMTCISNYQLCDNRSDCLHGDDEQFCDKNRSILKQSSICYSHRSLISSVVELFLCDNTKAKSKKQIIYFSLDTSTNYNEDDPDHATNPNLPLLSLIDKTTDQQQLYCQRGLDLQVWLNNKTNRTTCLCPPSYYGQRCQYQNQRISLSLQFRALSHSWQIPFVIIISLIHNNDYNQRLIYSYETFTYLSIRDCKIKFNIYLLYPSKSTNLTKDYFIHVDIYEKITLTYRGSLFLPIYFSFLPVHRLPFIINIPRDNQTINDCTNNQCQHGKCIRYANDPQNRTFCQCDRGWFGRFCNYSYGCTCSSDSICIGITNNNRSVCACPIHRFGPRCLLTTTICLNNNSICLNDGICIPNDEYMESNAQFTCICPKGFIGHRCEIVENKLTLSFAKHFDLPQSLFIHFIRIMDNDQPQRSTTLKMIPIKKDSIDIHWSQPYHIAFIEDPNKHYYLTVVQKKFNRTKTINKTISASDRCQNITEIFNDTVIQMHLIRRIKYYQIPCQREDLNLSCFYDDIHMCLCQQHRKRRVANCFVFNHNMTFDCFGQSVCENAAKCFQDNPNCPQKSICVCSPCFFGTRCQFSTKGFMISLDAILGYHIQPYVPITHQLPIVKISITLIIIFILVGFTNSILAIITFNNKSLRNVGCGLYLLCASIINLITTMMFGLKFWILILAQLGTITNRRFLSFQCHSIDFILRIGLNMDQWLNACVAMERAATVIQGTSFNKNKSKQIARKVIIILLIIIIGTNIQDPIYRHLVDDENDDEKRVWCIVSYSSGLQTWTYVMNILHFILPYTLNLISAISLIIAKARQKSNLQHNPNYRQVLREQFQQHKNLFIAPVILVLLSLPYLIISFVSKCMKSSNDSWLYLTGYFISFIPPMLTFVVFILPSKVYKQEFRKTVVRYRTNIRKRLPFISSR